MKHLFPLALLLALAGPAYAENERWTFTAQGQDFDDHPAAALAFGDNEPENPSFMLTCRPGRGVVRFHFWVDTPTEARHAVPATFASGAVRATVTVQAQGEEMYGGTEADGSLAARSPVIAAFRRSGRLSVSLARHPVSPTLRPAQPAMVARFLTACG